MVETYLRPQYPEQISKNRVIQNVDSRHNKDLSPDRGVCHVHRFQGRLLPHTNSKPVREVPAFLHPGSVLPVDSTII